MRPAHDGRNFLNYVNRSGVDLVWHHLRLFGLRQTSGVCVVADIGNDRWPEIESMLGEGRTVLGLSPTLDFLKKIDVAAERRPSSNLFWRDEALPWAKLCTLHAFAVLRHPAAKTLVRAEDGAPVWIELPIGQGRLILAGSDIEGDLLRYRQGDPVRAAQVNDDGYWGFGFERPLHLFEEQIKGQELHARPADYLGMAIATAVADSFGVQLEPLLPGGAPGAIVITGDDDQAFLEKYQDQLRELQDLPITYFLHPQTRHTRRTLRAVLGKEGIDLGLHPDALDAPEHYNVRLAEQAAWFRKLTRRNPISVRNHGFLSSGYWEHARAWRKEGILFSSNLPGVNGRVLNGSLLPARLVLDGVLTEHWSILTAIGDGVVFALKMGARESADCISALAQSVRSSGIPGVIVVNLHPQNVAEARSMHEAVRQIVRQGFVAWNMRQCLEWFCRRDGCGLPADTLSNNLWRRLFGWAS